jgi:outer membrane protein TolC
VEQRPDVRAVEADLHAASAQVGVAIANMLPQFTIDASLGSAATRIAELFTSATGFWSVGGNVTQSVVDGGTLLHRKRAAEAQLEQAAAQYRSTIIAAFENVADTLQALQTDADALHAAVGAERTAKQSVDIARRQIELGDVSYLYLLASEQAYQQALINRVQAQSNRFADTAALFQALGGGWWNRSESASSDNEASRSKQTPAANHTEMARVQ